MSAKVRLDEHHEIETWWNRYERSWVTMLVHANGEQCGNAEYDGTKAGRDASVRMIRVDRWCEHLEEARP